MSICKYKDIFGKPNDGVHSIRFLNIAIVDLLMTIIFSYLIHYLFSLDDPEMIRRARKLGDFSSLKKRITQKEINDLEESNKQMNEENIKMTSTMTYDIDKIINENDKIIKSKQAEITSLNSTIINSSDIQTKIDIIFSAIKKEKLIKDMNINWDNYNSLLKDNIWNYYLPIINMCNEKNKEDLKKYVSYYNFALLNIDYDKLADDEITVFMNYYTKVVNNIYSDFFDLEKYEDSEFNYVNNTILNIINGKYM